MDLRYLYFVDDLILLNENISNNRKFEAGFFQIHAGVEIVNRDNISRRLNSKIRSEYRDTDLKILFIFFDF
jgi:hypothetical protein